MNTITAFSSSELGALLYQAAAKLATDSAVTYLLSAHYYDRTNHPRYRHFPAVFALRQGEVESLEIGADFLAFDTEFIRYPERGEAHYPGPYADKFRATVPLAQVYQLYRKILTPAEQVAEQVIYGPETVIYYNAEVHRQYPTPADINQAYTAAPAEAHPLVAVLTTIKSGLANPNTHFLVNTTYFDSPDGPVLLGMLHLHTQTVWELTIEAEAFTCSVLLNPDHPQQRSTVRVDYDQVWQVVRSTSPQVDLEAAEEAGDILYEAPQVLSDFARQQRPA